MTLLSLALGVVMMLQPAMLHAEATAFKQAVAVAAASDRDIAEFYKSRAYQPIWTGASEQDAQRRTALIKALAGVQNHGLPTSRYDLEELRSEIENARTQWELGALEVALSQVFLKYARDVQTGVTVPGRIDKGIVRKVPYRERGAYLTDLLNASPNRFFRALPPQTLEYTALMKEKIRLERLLPRGGWGQQVTATALKPGARGTAVVEMRNRLIKKGYLARTNSQNYDDVIEAAVLRFQEAHGLEADGVAGKATILELNATVAQRLQSVIVAMERERWTNQERGARHILVNIPDFSAKVVDDGKVTFSTRSVVGARTRDRPTPEFSDVMEHMVINPSWYVPRSIMVNEYLPELQQNPNAVNHIEITDSSGRLVDRSAVDFLQFSASTFPFSMRQPPSRSNALGLVKFMFPNRHNIYLHDTPAKNLFGRQVRAFSHGCVRLADPFDFAYTLLARQTDDPEGFFKAKLRTGVEQTVDLEEPIPVHLIYRTAFATARDGVQFRRDIYGRDAKIWAALNKAGVALGGVQG